MADPKLELDELRGRLDAALGPAPTFGRNEWAEREIAQGGLDQLRSLLVAAYDAGYQAGRLHAARTMQAWLRVADDREPR